MNENHDPANGQFTSGGIGSLIMKQKADNVLSRQEFIKQHIGKPQTEQDIKNFKSYGHIDYSSDGTREYYKEANGDVYSAPLSNVMDFETGNRIGRFECSAAQWPKFKDMISLKGTHLGFKD